MAMVTGRLRRGTTTKHATVPSLPALVALSSLLATPSLVQAKCGVDFGHPTDGLTFHYLDTVNVTYTSTFSSPTLYCWCGISSPNLAFQASSSPYNGSALVSLNFTTPDVCWFALRQDSGECVDDESPGFHVLAHERRQGGQSTAGLSSSPAVMASTTTGTLTASSTTASTATATSTATAGKQLEDPNSLSAGAKAGIGIAIAGASIAASAIAACFYFRRRKRKQDAVLAGAIMDHERRNGRRVEKNYPKRNNSQNSGESTVPFEAVMDGFPGSTGYDDVRSLESSTYLHSPVSQPHSPTFPSGGFYNSSEHHTDLSTARLNTSHTSHTLPSTSPHSYYNSDSGSRLHAQPSTTFYPNDSRADLSNARLQSHFYGSDNRSNYSTSHIPTPPSNPSYPLDNKTELHNARMNSQPVTTGVISFGPNPVTPTRTPRPIHKLHHTPSITVSTDSREDVSPLVPAMPPLPFGGPAVMSYGPNRVTPNPHVTNVSIPLASPTSNQIPSRPTDPHPVPTTSLQRTFSFDAHDDAFALHAADLKSPNSPMAPLPPYASTADFYAMEKGAIRKLAEPAAQAELPPTKDGYYHFGAIENEYELPGAAPEHEPQLPYRGHHNGIGEVNEQKFLLDDAEMAHLREQKKRIRAQMAADAAAKEAAAAGASGSATASGSGSGDARRVSRDDGLGR